MVGVTRTTITARSSARHSGPVLLTAAAAWAWVVLRRGDMGSLTMAGDLPAFMGTWTIMMAAMMLPATAPVASLYARTVPVHRMPRMIAFTAGYVLVWAAAGLPAYALAVGATHVATARPTAGTAVAAAVFAVNGVYQLTALKDFCLTKCRSPIGLLLRYASYRGPSRHLRAGAHHGAFCLGCCWSLMLLLTAFGVMNLWAMVGLAALVTAEKRLPRGRLVARVAGLTSLALAVAVFWMPLLAPHLTGGGMTGMGLRHL
jgi:predicted metal-binding membrane protein